MDALHSLPRLTPPEPDASPCAGLTFALYIDADNQPAHHAATLLDLLQEGFGGQVKQITVAGNEKGNKNAVWVEALHTQHPDLAIQSIVVPCRPNAADIALMLALGADLSEHRRCGTRVVVVSRDALLLDAAEQVKESGIHLYVAYADSEIPTAKRTKLTTFLLPMAVETAKALPIPVAVPASAPPKVPAKTPIPSEIAKVMTQVRSTCTRQPKGGYSSNEVGQALAKLGYSTPAERKQILAQFPNLQVQGQGPDRCLVF